MYRVITQHPVALDSIDHLVPHGTAHDNSRNANFNRKLYQLFPDQKIRLADLGCSGGGFVKDVLDDGHEAIGLEGSDYSLLRKRAEWATIPNNLFTCDISRPFEIHVEIPGLLSYVPITAEFDVVTMWEVAEHLPEDRLGQVCANVRSHLAPGGLWIMSVSTQQGEHHVTVRHRQWWLELFDREGLENRQDLVEYFGDDWIRGPMQNAPESFHLILQRKST